jgi:uncharacterized protein (TIGR03067 family)
VEELRALEGTWLFTSLEVEGVAQPESAFRLSRLRLNGDRFRMESAEATYEGVFDINVEAGPHTIDVEFVEGPQAGNGSSGIYALEGDRLTICLGLTGCARPTAFKTLPGSGHALETLRRLGKDGEPTASGEAPSAQQEPVSQEGFDLMTPELEALQGEWVSLRITRDGMALPPEFAQSGRRVTEGQVTTVQFGTQVWMKGLTRVDLGQEPPTIDYLRLDGAAAGQVQRGIVRLDGQTMQICLAEPGAERPGAFSSPAGSGWTLSAWRRVG